MKAIGYTQPHPSAATPGLQDITLPDPVALGHDLLVEVHAVSVNPVDTKLRKSARPAEGDAYKVLGFDASGIVRAVGPEVSLFKPGDRVFYAGAIQRPGTNSALHLVDERIDLAIRTSNDLDPNLIARRLTVCRSVICASPHYLREHSTPLRVEELSRHNCLTHSYFGKSLWHFEEHGEHVSVPVHGNITANEASTLLRVTLAGAGVAMLPSYQAGAHIKNGELIRLLAAHPQFDLAYVTSRELVGQPLAATIPARRPSNSSSAVRSSAKRLAPTT